MTQQTIDFAKLQIFAEGGAGDAGGASAATEGSTGETAAEGSPEWLDAQVKRYFGVPTRSGAAAPITKTADAADGAQPGTTEDAADGGQGDDAGSPDAVPQEAEPQTKPTDDEDFDALIKGKHKDAFHKKVQAILNERFPKAKAAERRYGELLDAFAPYMDKIGWHDGDDVVKLKEAVLADRSNFAKLASDKGVTIEQAAREYQTAREQQAEQERQEAERERQEQQRQAEENQRVYDRWDHESEEIRKTVPGFDWRNEVQTNEQFARMLSVGVDVATAYRGTHFDEIMSSVAGAVAKKTAENVVSSIQTNRSRPQEGGLSAGAPVRQAGRLASLSDAEILRIFQGGGIPR